MDGWFDGQIDIRCQNTNNMAERKTDRWIDGLMDRNSNASNENPQINVRCCRI